MAGLLNEFHRHAPAGATDGVEGGTEAATADPTPPVPMIAPNEEGPAVVEDSPTPPAIPAEASDPYPIVENGAAADEIPAPPMGNDDAPNPKPAFVPDAPSASRIPSLCHVYSRSETHTHVNSSFNFICHEVRSVN